MNDYRMILYGWEVHMKGNTASISIPNDTDVQVRLRGCNAADLMWYVMDWISRRGTYPVLKEDI